MTDNYIESYGCITSLPDSRDYKIEKFNGVFPVEHILKIPKTKNQSWVSSCVSHSLASVNEYFYQKESGQEADFSVGLIYGYRPIEYLQSKGMMIREALKTISDVGNVPDYVFPYNEEIPKIKELVDTRIEELKTVASKYRITKYARLNGIEEIKTALLNGIPVIISVPIYNSFSPNLKGEINPPKDTINYDGNHALVIFGWKVIDGEERFVILNSWGNLWGQLGKAYLSQNYPLNEAWAIVDEEKSPMFKRPKWYWLWDLIYSLRKLF